MDGHDLHMLRVLRDGVRHRFPRATAAAAIAATTAATTASRSTLWRGWIPAIASGGGILLSATSSLDRQRIDRWWRSLLRTPAKPIVVGRIGIKLQRLFTDDQRSLVFIVEQSLRRVDATRSSSGTQRKEFAFSDNETSQIRDESSGDQVTR